ncbi:MAG: DUF4344 domain-containing metallopeptidase [Pyrinomonadaceae bacterium]|nr:DUF4344 domain-containing metallopeptidase [Pyrinomonadaceae bacterium]MCX7640051.1 DUF4344 domain-containing metallopeptidase [Pyrinomonadaceae bacterium]MDW8304223.1 DUF4344 domain-containing metallopeptidase [Acidobacteriota bacterium]
MRAFGNFLAFLLLVFTLSACFFRTDRYESEDHKVLPEIKKSGKTYLDKELDKGDFIVRYEPARDFVEYQEKIRQEKLLEKAADKLNQLLILPKDINIILKECNESNSSYDSQTSSIVICLNMVRYFENLFLSETSDMDEARQKAFDAMKFVFLHELGHALIDVYELPIIGNEEDAADKLSSFICINKLGEEGIKAVLTAAEAFRIEAKKNKGVTDFSDEHLLSEQRFYNSLCLIYGFLPEKYAYLVNNKYLPASRASKCQEEYARVVKSSIQLLSSWQKD